MHLFLVVGMLEINLLQTEMTRDICRKIRVFLQHMYGKNNPFKCSDKKSTSLLVPR